MGNGDQSADGHVDMSSEEHQFLTEGTLSVLGMAFQRKEYMTSKR